ncbi:type II toxin-antitoxin system RelE/ParE family toxin [Aliidiomarina celeris]|uniref:type II toxin-antitoxin system RelE/ParE family toxin n=1 Tax=Aliidiomarina celeris TaxID=2249428 RepID=UPI000DEBEE0A|nr:type II toxin-antitoxin system RelE/ParE family toxin [Aliidiomarina celeris]
MTYQVRFTRVGKTTLSLLQRYMTQYLGVNEAQQLVRSLITTCVEQLGALPLQYPVCPELDMLGVSDYRQITYQAYKILFRVDETSGNVIVMAFLRQRQSAQQLLIDYVLKQDG